MKGKPDRKWPVEDGITRWLYDAPFPRVDFAPQTKIVETVFI